MSPDFFDAMGQFLIASPLAAAFGDDASSLATTRIWADQSQPGVQMPRASYKATDEDRKPMGQNGSGMNYACKGFVEWTVTAAEKAQARQLSDGILKLLNDAPLVFADGELLEITPIKAAEPVVSELQSDSPTAYSRVVTFVYVVERTF